jgi:alanine dehydrogenase
LNNAAFGYVQNIAENSLSNALLEDHGLAKGVCTYQGYCSNEPIASIFNVEFRRLRVFSTN